MNSNANNKLTSPPPKTTETAPQERDATSSALRLLDLKGFQGVRLNICQFS
jgi:hypothetical protein